MPRARYVVNTNHAGNDQEDISFAQLRNERSKKRVRTPLPQPMEIEVQDEFESEGDYSLDVGQNKEQESHGRMPYSDSVLYKIGRVMQTLANILAEREKKKDKNASSTSYTMHGVKVPLLEFLKLAFATFKGVDKYEDP